MSSGNIVNQLHDQNGFSHTCAAEQANFSTFCIRTDQIDYLDSRFQYLCSRSLLLVRRSRTVNCPAFLNLRFRTVVHRLAQKIKHTAQTFFSYRNGYRTSGVYGLHPPHQTVCGTHGNTADCIITYLLSHFHDQLCAFIINFNGIEKCRQFIVRKADVQNRTDDLHNFANVFLAHL